MTAFLIGLGIGTPWVLACIGVCVWFHKSRAWERFCEDEDETGTEFPEPRKPV